MDKVQEIELGNWAMLVEQGLDPDVAHRAVKKYTAACAEAKKLRDRLEQVVIVCDDNASASQPRLALKFVRDIAATP